MYYRRFICGIPNNCLFKIPVDSLQLTSLWTELLSIIGRVVSVRATKGEGHWPGKRITCGQCCKLQLERAILWWFDC